MDKETKLKFDKELVYVKPFKVILQSYASQKYMKFTNQEWLVLIKGTRLVWKSSELSRKFNIFWDALNLTEKANKPLNKGANLFF